MFLVGILGYLPLFLWRLLGDPSYRKGLSQRLGRLEPFSEAGGEAPVLWVHGVSVGEVRGAQPLVERLEREFPDHRVLVSATTPTGARVARRIYGEDRVFFFPLDFGSFPRRALDALRPKAVLLMELEIWPNFLDTAERRGVPVMVVNGRISERSFKGYRLVRKLLPQFDRIDLFCVQNPTYAHRLAALGVSRDRIRQTGNLKYDGLDLVEEDPPPDPDLKALLDLKEGEVVLVGGSTHPDEEMILGRVALDLEKKLQKTVRLVVAPRHPERGAGVAKDLSRLLKGECPGRHPVLRLTSVREGREELLPASWLVADTIGELLRVYTLADLVFVGGSLVHHGGQNMLEPLALRKPTIVGPHVWNFRVDVDLFLKAGGLVQVKDEKELAQEALSLLESEERARALVDRAGSILLENKGATERTFREILPFLRSAGWTRKNKDQESSRDG